MKGVRILVLFGICLLLISAAPSGKMSGAKGVPDPGGLGPYAVGFTDFMLTDPSRGARPISTYVWYPVDPDAITGSSPEAVYPLDPYFGFLPETNSSDWEAFGIDPAYQEPPPSMGKPFPLVMFSPGWGCPAYFTAFVAARLASHGFVVAVLYHYGDGCWEWEPWDHLAVASFNRPLDVSFVLTDLLLKNQTSGDLFYGLINPDEVAAAGHSLGGYASMVLAGGDDEVCDKFFGIEIYPGYPDPPAWTCVPAFPDSRIKAIVSLDGSTQALFFEELARITVPTMGIGEEWSTLAVDPGWESWQARLHAASQGHPCYRVDVASAQHLTFTSICEFFMVLGSIGVFPQEVVDELLGIYCSTAVPSPEVQRLTAKYMIAFLKKNLAHEQGYQNILTPGYALSREQHIEFFVTEKRNANAQDDDWPDSFWYFMHQPGSAQAKAEKNPAITLLIPHLGHWK